MQYFTKELWETLNNSDLSVRINAENEWIRRDVLYQHEFDIIKKYLPRRFIEKYVKYNGFHDFIIHNLSITGEKKEYVCELQLSDGVERFSLIMFKVDSFLCDMYSLSNCPQKVLIWGYSEFELISNNKLKLSILCDNGSEIQIAFKSIKLLAQG